MYEPKKTFYCPHCGQKLSFLDGTLLKLEGLLEAPTFSVRTVVIVPAEVGRYGAIVAGDVEIRDGARVEFGCSNARCGANFTAAYHPDLAEIRMVDESGQEFVVIFNKIYGRHSTFVINRQAARVVQTSGEHASSYAALFDRPLSYFGQ